MTYADPTFLTAPAPIVAQPAVDPRKSFGDRFLGFLAFVLLGYAIGGRGFAYTGYPPVFIGEFSLLLGLIALLRCRAWLRFLLDAQAWPVLALFAWGASRTIPYLSEFGLDALRDGMSWGYAAFAFCVAAVLIERPARLGILIGRYRTFVPWFLIGILIAYTVYRALGQGRPEWPWIAVPILQVKEGDVLVHLAGVTAFWVSGLGGKTTWKWVALLTLNAGVMGVIDRAGMVAFGAVTGMCVLLRPMNTVAARLIGTVVLLLAVLWATDISIPIYGGKGREISFDQLVTNFDSIVSDTGSDGLDSTKEWRMDWWKSIANYTFNGKYFWTGKGYGINLADDDGFQVMADHSLRNPHSAHMTMLARGGVPGLALWAAVQITWGWAMFKGLLHSRRHGRREWEGLFFFLMAYWVALLINGSFDVFLEGPSGGIWYWVVYGTGLAANHIYRRAPDSFQLPPLSSAANVATGATA